jgi:hypothetical protein
LFIFFLRCFFAQGISDSAFKFSVVNLSFLALISYRLPLVKELLYLKDIQ